MYNLPERKTDHRFDQCMDMIGHDAPCQEPIPLAVKMEQRVLYNLSDSWITEPTAAIAFVGVPFYAITQFRATRIGGGFASDKLQLRVPVFKDSNGYRIGQTERDGLDHTGVVEMRQVAATVPFLMGSVKPWERGHPARIFLHLHPIRIFHPAQVLHCWRLARKRAR